MRQYKEEFLASVIDLESLLFMHRLYVYATDRIILKLNTNAPWFIRQL